MADYSSIFDTLLQNQLHSPAAYDKPSVAYVQSLVIAFRQLTTDRDIRMKIIRDVVGRNVHSTKDLKVAEVATLLKMLDNSAFIRDMQNEYGIEVKGEQA